MSHSPSSSMIPLAVPNLCGREGRYLQECIESGFVSSIGPFVDRLEAMTAAACGAQYGVATSSGTCALHLALLSVGVATGDLVVAPSFTFIATANAIAHCGAAPWLFDVNPASWTLDADQVVRALERKTARRDGYLVHAASGRRVSAILPVYALGNPPDMGRLAGIARGCGLPLVADGAAALGANCQGKPIGGLADATMISFNGNKTVTAGGGGMIVGNDEAIVRLARHISTTARVGDDYDHDRVGYNFRMTNLQAAVGCAQMEQLEHFVARKREVRARYHESLGDLPGIGVFPDSPWGESAFWLSGIVLPPGWDATAFCDALRSLDIEARTFWKPVHLQAPFRDAPAETMEVTDSFWRRVVTLPCSTSLSADDQNRVIEAVLALVAPVRNRE